MIPEREIKIKEIEHKARSIEFERGLRKKMEAEEEAEIIQILQKYGISVSKKLGNAVFRNKYKRKIRSIIDNYKKMYINHEDYIIILRRGAVDKSFQDLEKDFLALMKH